MQKPLPLPVKGPCPLGPVPSNPGMVFVFQLDKAKPSIPGAAGDLGERIGGAPMKPFPVVRVEPTPAASSQWSHTLGPV